MRTVAIITSLALTSAAFPEGEPTPTLAGSENGRFSVDTEWDGSVTLTEMTAPGEFAERWSVIRHPGVAPQDIHVSNDGRCVVLQDEMSEDDEHGKMLVFLGPEGEVLAEHDYADVLPEAETDLNMLWFGELAWREDARFFFLYEGAQFALVTAEMTTRLFDCATGERVAVDCAAGQAIRDELVERTRADLQGHYQHLGIVWAGLLKEPSLVPHLSEIIDAASGQPEDPEAAGAAAEAILSILGDKAVPVLMEHYPAPDAAVNAELARVLTEAGHPPKPDRTAWLLWLLLTGCTLLVVLAIGGIRALRRRNRKA